MASKVQIANIALIKAGAGRITSFDDGSKPAQLLNVIYDPLLDAELSDHPWSFAIQRFNLPASSTAPAFGWQYAYPLPMDFLKLVQVGDDWTFYVPLPDGLATLFTVESGAVLTDQQGPLQVRTVQRITDSGRYSALFVQALACSLAAEMCESLTQNLTKKQELLQEREMIIKRARRSNDIELPSTPNIPTSWEFSAMQMAG